MTTRKKDAKPAAEQQKKKGGRPEWEPTQQQRNMIEAMSGYGLQDYEIAKVLEVSGPTLRKHCWRELELGHLKMNAKVAQSLFKITQDPKNPKQAAACMFWMKCRAGWREMDPLVPREPPLGKKEQADRDAQTADEGTEWDGLLNPRTPIQ